MEVSKFCFFDTMTTQNDHPSYVKHVLGGIFVFFGCVCGGGGGGKGQVHNMLIQFLTLAAQGWMDGCFQKNFIMTTHNDHPSYAKHVLGIIYVFFCPSLE